MPIDLRRYRCPSCGGVVQVLHRLRGPMPGLYFPVGRLLPRALGSSVVTGLQVVHETYFERGDVLPELVGYQGDAVWVRYR